MANLILHMHPFAAFCQKVLVALYENATPFETVLVDLGDEASRNAFAAIWPIARMPVLEDRARGVSLPESTIIIEHLDLHYPGATRWIPENPDLAIQTRLQDRFFDFYVADPMQRIVFDRIRPEDAKDPLGVEAARAMLDVAYGMIERRMADRTWAMGEAFTLADCAAAPALFYADWVHPLEGYPNARAYRRRLLARPAFARAVEEARPFRANFPGGAPDAD